MEVENYTKSEMNLIFEKMDNHHSAMEKQMDSIENQVKLTNGRVNKLENWRWFIMGGLGILSLLLVPVVVSLAIA